MSYLRTLLQRLAPLFLPTEPADGPSPERYEFRPPAPEPPPGWPDRYYRRQIADGAGWVVTVCEVPTSAPIWATEEMARVDAWERAASDPDPELGAL